MNDFQAQTKHIIEAALLVSDRALTKKQLLHLFEGSDPQTENEINNALSELADEYKDRAIELKQIANGYRIQSRQEIAPYLLTLWEEKPPKYSRAVLETLVLIAYRQPITRAEIEEVRGVSVSSHIVRSLLEREWIRVIGHKDVPGKPALLATTKTFLEYFNLQSLEDLPTLTEVRDLDAQAEILVEQLGWEDMVDTES